MTSFPDVETRLRHEDWLAVSTCSRYQRQAHQAVDDGDLAGDDDQRMAFGYVGLEGQQSAVRDSSECLFVLFSFFSTGVLY